jgi:hypothetical protein
MEQTIWDSVLNMDAALSRTSQQQQSGTELQQPEDIQKVT